MEPVIHERHFHRVPSSVVEEMVDDFLAYRSDGVGDDQRKVYRFQVDGEEMVLALDFEEVIAVMAEEP